MKLGNTLRTWIRRDPAFILLTIAAIAFLVGALVRGGPYELRQKAQVVPTASLSVGLVGYLEI